jgi:hypothetical protein
MRHRALIVVIMLFASLPAGAKIGSIDVVPAATILVPYWEVDPFNLNGVDTLVTIHNASATATLVHATLWTDYGIPTETFDVYLTGFDQETFSMREIVNRLIPVTASDGQDPRDTISPQGPISQDINFASCTGQLPGGEQFMTGQLPDAHTGQEASEYFGAGNCGARDFGDGIARGYLTLDVANLCSCGETPARPGYFVNGGGGIAGNRNVILGEVTVVDPANGRSFTEPAVHIEANFATLNTPGEYTFYGRLLGYSATDNREALPTAWAGKWAENRTTAEYWRDPGVPVVPFLCGTTPFALDERQIRAFDESGTDVATASGGLFPQAAGITSGGTDLDLTSGWGSLYLNLNLPAPSGTQGIIRQSWITWRQVPRDQLPTRPIGYAVQGIQLGNANAGDDPVVP